MLSVAQQRTAVLPRSACLIPQNLFLAQLVAKGAAAKQHLIEDNAHAPHIDLPGEENAQQRSAREVRKKEAEEGHSLPCCTADTRSLALQGHPLQHRSHSSSTTLPPSPSHCKPSSLPAVACVPPHDTAQHSAAQRSTAQHSTAHLVADDGGGCIVAHHKALWWEVPVGACSLAGQLHTLGLAIVHHFAEPEILQ
jgi:hypothetical protein